MGIWKICKRRQMWPNNLKHHERYFVPESITCSLDGDGVSSLWPNNVGTTERAIAGVGCGRFGTIRLKFHCQLPSGEPFDRDIFERESRLAADKGNGILTMAVEYESGSSKVAYSVVIENKRLLVLEGSDGWVFLLLEYDFYLINLYCTNAPSPFKSASYECTKSFTCPVHSCRGLEL
jgi:hypothetical protein